MTHRILVVDDEPHIREVVCFALDRAGLATTTARNGAEAVMAQRTAPVDLIVLDVGMPDMDGLEACKQIRKSSNVPILFLSARDEEVDRIIGLEIGGDDYVTKPFSPRELVARVKAILKRTGAGALESPAPTVSRGSLVLDRGGHSVRYGDLAVPLTGLEFAILDTLLGRPEMVFSREQLMNAAYGPGIYVADRTIDSHVRNLRAKFTAAGCAGIVTTVHGVGFRLGDLT